MSLNFEMVKAFALGLLIATIFSSLYIGEFSKESELIIAVIGTAFLVPFLRSLTKFTPKKWLRILNKEL